VPKGAGRRRLPKNYERIYELVCEQPPGRHRTASEVYASARERHPGIGVSTVYRGLTRLRDLGLVAEIVVPGAGSAVYEKAAPEHAHFRCSACADVQDVAYRLPGQVMRRLSLANENRISGASLTFHGLCRTCAAEASYGVLSQGVR